MDYYLLADFAAQIGYRLAMAGAETFRVEDWNVRCSPSPTA